MEPYWSGYDTPTEEELVMMEASSSLRFCGLSSFATEAIEAIHRSRTPGNGNEITMLMEEMDEEERLLRSDAHTPGYLDRLEYDFLQGFTCCGSIFNTLKEARLHQEIAYMVENAFITLEEAVSAGYTGGDEDQHVTPSGIYRILQATNEKSEEAPDSTLEPMEISSSGPLSKEHGCEKMAEHDSAESNVDPLEVVPEPLNLAEKGYTTSSASDTVFKLHRCSASGCSKMFTTEPEVKLHYADTHGRLVVGVDDRESSSNVCQNKFQESPKKFRCDFQGCGKSFRKNDGLRFHRGRHGLMSAISKATPTLALWKQTEPTQWSQGVYQSEFFMAGDEVKE